MDPYHGHIKSGKPITLVWNHEPALDDDGFPLPGGKSFLVVGGDCRGCGANFFLLLRETDSSFEDAEARVAAAGHVASGCRDVGFGW